MSEPAIPFKDRSVPDKLAICREILQRYAALPPDVQGMQHAGPLLAQLAAVEGELEHIAELQTRLRTALLRRNALVDRLCREVRYAGRSLVTEVKGDPIRLLRGGFRLPEPRRPLPPPPCPTGLRVVPGSSPGTLQVRWRSPQRRACFVVELNRSPDRDDTWEMLSLPVTPAKALITGLTPGTRVAIRVRATSARGLSAWTDPVFTWVL